MENSNNNVENKRMEELEIKIDDLHDALIGPKLLKETGLMHRLLVMEKNIGFMMEKWTDIDKKFTDQINAIKLEKESTKVKLGVIWFLTGTVVSGTIMSLIGYILMKK